MSATPQTFLTSLLPPFFHRAVVFTGSALVHPPHPSSFVRFCLLFFSSLKGTLKVFVASLCYWLLKRYFQYLMPQKYNSLSSTLALFFCLFFLSLFVIFVRLLELLSIKREFITIYVTLLPFYIDLCRNLSAFLRIKCETQAKELIFFVPKWFVCDKNHFLCDILANIWLKIRYNYPLYTYY